MTGSRRWAAIVTALALAGWVGGMGALGLFAVLGGAVFAVVPLALARPRAVAQLESPATARRAEAGAAPRRVGVSTRCDRGRPPDDGGRGDQLGRLADGLKAVEEALGGTLGKQQRDLMLLSYSKVASRLPCRFMSNNQLVAVLLSKPRPRRQTGHSLAGGVGGGPASITNAATHWACLPRAG